MTSPLPAVDFRPTASWANLRLRADLLRRVREFFDADGFLEVETPILSAETVIDRHLDPFAVATGTGKGLGIGDWGLESADSLQSPIPNPQSPIPSSPVPSSPVPSSPTPSSPIWLQTSPELGMKRLLAAGATAIYQITRAFRREESGPLHNPEFTMVEWYRAGDGMAEGIERLSGLCDRLLGRGPAERLAYGAAFERYVGLDPHRAAPPALAAAARRLGVSIPASHSPDDRDGWLDLLMVDVVEPHLGQERPTILYDYPASQSALAQVRPGSAGVSSSTGVSPVCRAGCAGRGEAGLAGTAGPTDAERVTGETPVPLPVVVPLPAVAERFELYVSGIELANGYHELLDAAVLRRRDAENNRLRQSDGKLPLPEPARLLAAMEAGLPPATGVALGFDRVVMLAAGATNLRDVITFPADRA